MSLGILAVLAGIGVTGLSSMRDYFVLQSAVQDVQTAFLNARAKTMASNNNAVHGVHIETDKVVQFVGPTYTAGASSSIIFLFPPQLTATSSLTGSSTDVVFSRFTGRAQATGTVTLFNARSNASSTMTVQNSGFLRI